MKRTVLMMGAFVAGTASAAELARDGVAGMPICHLASEGSPVAFEYKPYPKRTEIDRFFDSALMDLGKYLSRMTGGAFAYQAVTNATEVPAKAIVVGELAKQLGVAVSASEKGMDAFRREVRGDRVYLVGNGRTGSIYAVNDFLFSLGVDWLMPGEQNDIVPSRRTISLKDEVVESAPDFSLRSMQNSGGGDPRLHAAFKQWLVRHKGRFLGWPRTEDEIWTMHTAAWHKFRDKKWDPWYEKHPEIAALAEQMDGTKKRRRYQLNTHSPHAVEMVAEAVREAFAKNKWPKDRHVIFDMTPGDGSGFDVSDESLGPRYRYRDALSGMLGQSEAVFEFLNKVRDRVKDEFPNLRPWAFSYDIYSDCPKNVRPDTNTCVTIADIGHSRRHGACDAAVAPSRAYYLKQLKEWAASGCEISFWNYNNNLADGVLPFTRLRIIGEDWPLYKKFGFSGMFQNECGRCLSSAAAHNYLQVRILWDVSLDWRKVTEEFCRKAYGDGWREMYDYYIYLTEVYRKNGDETGSFFGSGRLFSRQDYAKLRDWVETARAKAKDDGERYRVGLCSYAVEQLGRFLEADAAIKDYRFADASNTVARMIAVTEAKTKEDPWCCHYDEKVYLKCRIADFVDSAVRHSSGANRMVARLPERMRVMIDPDGNGEDMNFASPLIDDREFPEFSTYLSTACRQGLVAYRHGDLWYRTRIRLPKTELKAGEGVGLLLGGFDNRATVFVNGVKAGTAIGLGEPAAFDVTDYLRKDGGEDTFVIRVRRDRNWEVMTAGLIYPGFFFVGPRVPPQSDAAAGDFELVLPGNVK